MRDAGSAATCIPDRQSVKTLSEHPEADLVPTMPASEFQALLEDIRRRGILEPLHVQFDGTVLDGRHRLRAARALGLATVPVVLVRLQDETPVSYMLRAALLRRHLTEDQKAIIAEGLRQALSREAQAEQRKQAAQFAGRPRKIESGTVPEPISAPAPVTVEADLAPDPEPAPHELPERRAPSPAPRRDTRREAAERVGLPPESRKVRDAQQIAQKAPELIPAIRSGEKTIQEAKREIKQRELAERVEEMERAAAEVRATQEPLGQFLLGDCLDIISSQDIGTFDLVLTDPPYSRQKSLIAHTERKSIDTDFGPWDGPFDLTWVQMLPQLLDNKTGQVLIFCPLEAIGGYEEHLSRAGMVYRGAVVWHKTNPGIVHRPVYLSSCEAMVWATASNGSGHPHFTPWANCGAREVHNHREGPICQGEERLSHPTQKPLWLLRDLVERHAMPGHRILDPFAGVASTLVAAEERGCRYLGIERDQDFHRQGMARLTRCGGAA